MVTWRELGLLSIFIGGILLVQDSEAHEEIGTQLVQRWYITISTKGSNDLVAHASWATWEQCDRFRSAWLTGGYEVSECYNL
jgi:hypothetical protein